MKKTKAPKKKKTKVPSSGGANNVLSCVIAVGVAIVLWLVLVLVFSAIASKNSDPGKLITPLGFASSCLSAFVCGMVSGKLTREKGVLCGLISGGMFTLILFVMSFVFPGENGIVYATSLLFSILLASVLGARLASKPKSRTKRASHR